MSKTKNAVIDQMNASLPLGTEVRVGNRVGIITRYNENTILDKFNGYDYPYIVKFSDGYSDYCEGKNIVVLNPID